MTQELSPPSASQTSKALSPATSRKLLEQAQTSETPPDGVPAWFEALWWDAHGDQARALQIVENEPGLNSVWVHAYLRRKLGDEATAAYWYSKAIRPKATGSHVVERDHILEVLIG